MALHKGLQRDSSLAYLVLDTEFPELILLTLSLPSFLPASLFKLLFCASASFYSYWFCLALLNATPPLFQIISISGGIFVGFWGHFGVIFMFFAAPGNSSRKRRAKTPPELDFEVPLGSLRDPLGTLRRFFSVPWAARGAENDQK